MGDKKLHAIVVRSTFPSQNARNAPCSEHFWEFRCSKSARRCGAKHISTSKRISTSCSDHSWKLRCRNAKHISKSKVLKTDGLRPLLEVEMLKKCAKHVSSKCKKKPPVGTAFGRSDVVSRGRCKGFGTLPKSSKT